MIKPLSPFRSSWTEDHVCELLVGEAAILRETYFGELIYDEQRLKIMHECATAPVSDKWIPKLHVTVDVEEHFSRTLLRPGALAGEEKLLNELSACASALGAQISDLDQSQIDSLHSLGKELAELRITLETTIQASDNGQFSLVADAVSECKWNRMASDTYHRLLRKLRARSVPVSLTLSHALVVRRRAFDAMDDITRLLRTNFVAFVGGKGFYQYTL